MTFKKKKNPPCIHNGEIPPKKPTHSHTKTTPNKHGLLDSCRIGNYIPNFTE